MDVEAEEDPCVTCRRPVKEDEAALACDLCEKWEHVACIRQCDKLSDALYTALVGCRSKALLYVCSVCRRGGSVAKRLLQHEVEKARADRERLASAREIDDRLRELEECNRTIVELHREKQQLVEHSKAF